MVCTVILVQSIMSAYRLALRREEEEEDEEERSWKRRGTWWAKGSRQAGGMRDSMWLGPVDRMRERDLND